MGHDNNNSSGVLIPSAFIIAISLVVCAFVIKSAMIAVKGFGRTIAVTGAATKPISADYALWEGRIETSSTDLQTAYSKMDKQIVEVKSFMSTNGFADNAYSLGTIQINRMTDRQNQQITYSLARVVKTESSDIEKIRNLSTLASSLIEKGVEISSTNPKYVCTKIDDYKVEMIKAATENAKLRAQQLAETTGKKVGAPASARVGVFQIRPLHSQEVSDYGINDVTSIDKEIVCTVQISFMVE